MCAGAVEVKKREREAQKCRANELTKERVRCEENYHTGRVCTKMFV